MKLRGKQLEQHIDKLIDLCMANGIAVVEMGTPYQQPDICCQHLVLIGSRHVNYYPTTGTVFADGVPGKFSAFRGQGMDTAIRAANMQPKTHERFA